jgi:hypothetical protein
VFLLSIKSVRLQSVQLEDYDIPSYAGKHYLYVNSLYPGGQLRRYLNDRCAAGNSSNLVIANDFYVNMKT